MSTDASISSQRMEACAVVGGSGFIGSHLIAELTKRRIFRKIYVLDLNPCADTSPTVEYVPCDIRESINFTPDVEVTHCINLAALCKEPGHDWDEYFITNYIGTKRVIGWLDTHDIKNVYFTSTEMVYRSGDRRNNEDSLPNADTAYGISKYFAELELQRWRSSRVGRTLRIIRPGAVFGPRENGNFTRLYKALKYNLFTYVGSRNTVKACVYVKDLVDFLIYLLRVPTSRDVFNFTLPVPYTIEEIVEAVIREYRWRRMIPVLPYWLAIFISNCLRPFFSSPLKNPFHPRRIQKLFYSTNMSVDAALSIGFRFQYDLSSAIRDWRMSSDGGDLR